MDSGARPRSPIVVVDALEVSVEGDLHRELAERLAEPLRAIHEHHLAEAYERSARLFNWAATRYLERKLDRAHAFQVGQSHGYDQLLVEHKLRQVQLAVDLTRPRPRGSELRS